MIPSVAVEYEQAQLSPEVQALDAAHQLAFRRGLGNSLFASPHTAVGLQSVVAHGRSAFSNTSGIAVLASGIDNGSLGGIVDEFFTGSSASFSASSPAAVKGDSGKSAYFGGESRLPATAHGGHGKGSLLVAFQGGAQDQPEYAVLRSLLGGENAIKWTNGLSPLSQLTPLVGNDYKPVVKSFNLHYSDAGLLGFFISAPTEKVTEIASKSVEALKSIASGGVKDEELKRAIAKTKFAAANVMESRLARQELIGSQVCALYSTQRVLHFEIDELSSCLRRCRSSSPARSPRSRTHSQPSTACLPRKCKRQPRRHSRANPPLSLSETPTSSRGQTRLVSKDRRVAY